MFVIASKSTLPMRPSSSSGQPKNSYRSPRLSVSRLDTRQSSAMKRVEVLEPEALVGDAELRVAFAREAAQEHA